MSSAPDWYEAVADDSLEQGDLFGDCQIVVPRYFVRVGLPPYIPPFQ